MTATEITTRAEAAHTLLDHQRTLARELKNLGIAANLLLVEVYPDGHVEMGRVTPGTGSLAAHEGRAWAFYLRRRPSRHYTISDIVHDVIDDAEAGEF